MPVPNATSETLAGGERRRFIAIRRESDGYGIRFGLTEEEDKLRHGPVFATLPEALAWIASVDGQTPDAS